MVNDKLLIVNYKFDTFAHLLFGFEKVEGHESNEK